MPIGVVLAGETLLPTTVNDQEGYLAELEKTVPIGPVQEYGMVQSEGNNSPRQEPVSASLLPKKGHF